MNCMQLPTSTLIKFKIEPVSKYFNDDDDNDNILW